jgi:hypothetical protein
MTAPAAANGSGKPQQCRVRAVADRLGPELTADGLPEAIAIRHMNPLRGGADLQKGMDINPQVCRR